VQGLQQLEPEQGQRQVVEQQLVLERWLLPPEH